MANLIQNWITTFDSRALMRPWVNYVHPPLAKDDHRACIATDWGALGQGYIVLSVSEIGTWCT